MASEDQVFKNETDGQDLVLAISKLQDNHSDMASEDQVFKNEKDGQDLVLAISKLQDNHSDMASEDQVFKNETDGQDLVLAISKLFQDNHSDMASEDQVGLFKNEKDGQDLILAISKFALDLYKEQGKRSKGNLFMSPLSISAVLSMAYLGARGKTLKEMKKTLCLEALEDAKVHQAFSDFISYLKKCSQGSAFQLHMANRLYAEESFKILKEFQNACRNHYDAELVPVSFRSKGTESAIREINKWVEENTNQKIKDIVSPRIIKPSTVLVLVNAIYFKGSWKNKFNPYNTLGADFLVSKGETMRVQMMFRKVARADYCYSNDLSCQVLKLPYKSGALSMFILLPDKKSSSLEDLEKKLTAKHLINIDRGFKKRPEVNLYLPKFKMEEDLELKEVLGDMGMKSIFESRSADLSGISGAKDLYASKVVHKAFVDVNEEGTEAAAATAMGNEPRCCGKMDREEPVEFRADHPFLFFIREEKAKAILFLGRAVAPKHS